MNRGDQGDFHVAHLRLAQADGYPMDALRADLAAAERNGHALERARADRLVASLSRAVPGNPLCTLTLVGPATEFTADATPVR